MKKFVIIAMVFMAFAATNCTSKKENLKKIPVLHDPIEWDSSLYVPHSAKDSLIKRTFMWSTGEETPTITTSIPGGYEFTYSKYYASGITSSITQTFLVIDSVAVIDPLIEVYYLWSTGDTTPAIDITELGNYTLEETWVYASGIHNVLSQFFKVRDSIVLIEYTPFEYNQNDIKGYEVYEYGPGELTYIEYIEN